MTVTLKLVVKLAELVGAFAEAAELFGEGVRIERSLAGLLQGLLAVDGDGSRADAQRLAGFAADGHVERVAPRFESGILPGLAQFALQLWIGGFVDGVAGLDAIEIDTTVLLMEDDALVLDFPDASPLFQVAVLARVKDHAVTGIEGDTGGVGQFDPTVLNLLDGAK